MYLDSHLISPYEPRASTRGQTASETTGLRLQSLSFLALPVSGTLSYPHLPGKHIFQSGTRQFPFQATSRSTPGMSKGSGISSQDYPSGIINDIDVATKTTGAAIGF